LLDYRYKARLIEEDGTMHEFFDEKETLTGKEREEYFNRKLAAMAAQGYERSSALRKIFDERGIRPDDIRTVDDLQKFPVISRSGLIELQAQDPPFGGFCDTQADIDRIFTSPGPVYEPHLSPEDPLWARAYWAAGFRRGDIVLNAFSYHMVAAGLTFHGGLRRVGATVVPSGSSGAQQQVQLIRDLKVTGYTGTPSFLMSIIDKAAGMGYDFARDFSVRRASFGAEPLQPSMRKRFEEEYGIDTYQMYGATEVGDIAYECREKNGWHICEEVIVEIVDPETGRRLPDGELGEVVVTRLNSIFFLLRFATGDLSSLMPGLCPCGRASRMLSGIAGRLGDAVKVRGMFVAPSQLKRLSLLFDGLRFQLVVTRPGHRDHLAARLETGATGDALREITSRFDQAFREICTVKIDSIETVPAGTLGDSAPSIVDQRSWK